MSGDLLLYNAGTILTGNLAAPRASGDAVLVKDGLIAAVGTREQFEDEGRAGATDEQGRPRAVVDVGGATIAPGLIDPHTHPVLGDYTPRQGTSGWISSYLHGGVTTLVSAGEPHWPGRPRTAAGTKAVAIAAAQSAMNLRPGGAKLVAGALLLEPGLTATDIDEMAAAGVRLLGEIGLGALVEPADVKPLVDAAHAHGWTVPMHIGGASVPGSHVLGAEAAIAIQPDIASHTNGGPTARSLAEIEMIFDGTSAAIEVVQAGNIRALRDIVTMLIERDGIDRLQIGTDTPSGTGVIPLGILRTIAYCCALAGLDPALAICAATGQTAGRYKLDAGILAPGRAADLIVIDAPIGGVGSTALDALSIGDTPAIAAVIVDGVVQLQRSRVTPPPVRTVTIIE